ncbi:MAG: fluoride efflux transporter CrcB [Actinomycetota bacterium]
MTLLLVALGAALGAPARYLLDRAVQARAESDFPWGTLVVNVSGSALLGVVVSATDAAAVPRPLVLGVGAGFCGALTTYSTFGWETVRLVAQGSALLAFLNVFGTVLACLGAVFVGVAVGSWL